MAVIVEIKKNLLATLETALFMAQGPKRFGSSMGEMLRSWAVLAVVILISLASIYYIIPMEPRLQGLSFATICALFILQGIVGIILVLAIFYTFTGAYDRRQYFFPFITASNWTGLIMVTFHTLIIAGFVYGRFEWNEVQALSVVASIYGYVNIGFALTYVLHIPWQLGGFLAICNLAVNETCMHAMYWLAAQL
jgi:hypothetical protein